MKTRALHLTLLAAAALLVGASSASASGAVCESWGAPVAVGNLGTRALDEASGMTFSRAQEGVIWLHNDSGDDARFFATAVDGTFLGRWALKDVDATDWEDIALGPCADGVMECLWIADIGNNTLLRKTMQIYRVREPKIDRDAPPMTHVINDVETIEFQYPDGDHYNAEALFVAKDGTFWIVSKAHDKATLFRGKVGKEGLVQLVKVGHREKSVDLVTAADLAPDETRFVIRGYDWAAEFSLADGKTPGQAFEGAFTSMRVAVEPQGEAIAYDPSGDALYTTSEERHQPIFRYTCQALDGAPVKSALQEVEAVDIKPPVKRKSGWTGCSAAGAGSAGLVALFVIVFARVRRRR